MAEANSFHCYEDMKMITAAEQTEYHRFLQSKAIDGNWEAVECMIAQNLKWRQDLTPVKHNPMHTAIQKGNLELVSLLLRIENLAHEPNCYGETPLHLACLKNLKGVVSQLLQLGVDVDARNNEEGTPLFHAVFGDSIDCVQLLIEAGCDLDALTCEHLSPMDQALLSSHTDSVTLLLCAGCSTDKLQGHVYYKEHVTNSFFYTLLEKGDLHNMQLFLDCGYCISPCEMKTLKSICYEQCVDERYRNGLEMLKEVTERPQKLTTLCRWNVRRMLMKLRCQRLTPIDAMIGHLPVPDIVKQFLMMTKPLEPGKESSLKETSAT